MWKKHTQNLVWAEGILYIQNDADAEVFFEEQQKKKKKSSSA